MHTLLPMAGECKYRVNRYNDDATPLPATLISRLQLSFTEQLMSRLYICTGPHCRLRGADTIRRALEQAIWQAGLLSRIECIASGCQDHCAVGPNLLLQPGGQRFHGVTPADVTRIVEMLNESGV